MPSYGRTAGHIATVAYNDSPYKDLTRYYYYYQQCNPDVVAAHGLNQHHLHQHHQQQQQPSVLGLHPHDGGGIVYHHGTGENGGDGAETTGRGGDGYGGESTVLGGTALRYYGGKATSAGAGLVVDGCRPVTAPVANWTQADHGQYFSEKFDGVNTFGIQVALTSYKFDTWGDFASRFTTY